MLSNLIVRDAELSDLDQIVSLCEKHAAYENAEYASHGKLEKLKTYLFSQKVFRCLVAEQQDEIVAYATFMKQFATWDADYYVYLDCLYLEEKIRGHGLGLAFMNRIKHFAMQEKCSIIQWQTPSLNYSAISFYKKLGAEEKCKSRFFWRIG